MFRIAHISDLHCGSPYFMPDLMERAIMEINELEPEIVVCSGDLTAYGFRPEYAEAKAYLDRLDCKQLVVVPGNHDSRNVGYIHFEELFGDRNPVVHVNGVSIVAVDSTEPDLDHGHIGRSRYPWIQEQFSQTRTSASSSSTTICCLCPGPAVSGTSSTTRATLSRRCSAPGSTSSFRATSTCRTPGGWRTSSSSMPARCPLCA